MTDPIWQASASEKQATQMATFTQAMAEKYQKNFSHYEALYQWSIAEPEQFWQSFWDFAAIVAHRPAEKVLIDPEPMQKARWFVGAELNYAENCLQRRDDGLALLSIREEGGVCSYSYHDLYDEVAKLAAFLKSQGVSQGDRVAGLMPNCAQAVVAMLATTSLGAIWSSCSPDFGEEGILDRFGQIEPKVVFVCNGYVFKGKKIDLSHTLLALEKKLPTVRSWIFLPYLSDIHSPSIDFTLYQSCLDNEATEIDFQPMAFNAPLYILFSSGTTGKPKCIVHGVGGTLLQHLKELRLHSNLGQEDKLFFYSTCGWMMWNWMVSGLAVGASLILYDGSPMYPEPTQLFDILSQHQVNFFGTSAKYLSAIEKAAVSVRASHDLAALRAIFTTGSPLVAEGFDYVYEHIKADVCLSSISGGTDIVSCFALGNPCLPVYRGQLQCRGLGMAVDFYNEAGVAVREEKAELVCTKPFPSMPIAFWQDEKGEKYHQAYFNRFDGVWAHGDYAELTAENGIIIYGRSDAVLNPGGVRIGTAEIYRQVEKLDEVLESLAVGQSWQDCQRVVLFVVLRADHTLDTALQDKICQTIRLGATPRHVPAKIIAVADLPRTVNGKLSELAVRDVIHGQTVKNMGALANPECLSYFKELDQLSH